eukprot:m.212930 g.212930  ORF g.212930 m.212930 type:complete len:53 (+) comp33137_c0_seq1:365-523(+)
MRRTMKNDDNDNFANQDQASFSPSLYVCLRHYLCASASASVSLCLSLSLPLS